MGINMQSIAFFNNKGGVGKTTLLCNLAAYLALIKKKKVLVVDADPQCNATQLMLDETEVLKIYDTANSFTIYRADPVQSGSYPAALK
ncbi:AAA family ATPase [Rhizobium ecuadorense]|uniref:AAA family ATPase n=1 Tax=Rhizobium ecuadorense TaxID=1671795 RepID=UPI00192D0381